VLNRRAFTMIEIIVAVVVLALLTAVIVPTVRARLTSAYETALITELNDLTSALIAYHHDIGKWPPNLQYLTAMPALGVGAFNAKDLCGNAINASQGAAYRGPYISSQWPSDSVFDAKDTIEAALYKSTDSLGIQVNGPDATEANDIDIAVDGVASQTTGIVQYSPRGNGNTLTWFIPRKPGSC
jgi:prepilin-type N-terminal cleavage/methylation domain-containing protein